MMPKHLSRALPLALAMAASTTAIAANLFVPVPVAKSTAAPELLQSPQAVRFDAAAIIDAGVGGTVDALLPNGRAIVIELDHVERHDNGDVSWRGRVRDGARDDLRATGTAGAAGAFAHLESADGHWAATPAGEGATWLFDRTATEATLPPTTEFLRDDAIRPPPVPAEAFAKATCPAVTGMPSTQVTIDVLAVMAPDFVATHGGAGPAETRLNAIFNNLNAYNAASNIAVTYRRVGTLSANYQAASTANDDDSDALDAITQGQGSFAHVAAIRNFYGADLVALFRGPKNTAGSSISGVAWINGDGNGNMPSGHSPYMYSVHGDAKWASGTLPAHELGHNLGNEHDRPNAGGGGSTPYSFGHYVCGTGASANCGQAGANNTGTGFGTIMAYHTPTVARFSSPSLSCKGPNATSLTAPCGVADQQDDVRATNCVRSAVAAMRTSWVGTCSNLTLDTDRDGIPDCVEGGSGKSTSGKDNDIFASGLLFSAQQYRDFLSREADAEGLNYWMGALANGSQTRGSMVEAYFNSAEFQGAVAPVARLYFAYFLRVPDYGGLQHWIGQFRAGTALAQISQSFAASAEFVNRYGALTNPQFVTLVYANVLGRAPDAAGLAHWTGQLTTGAMTRGGVMLAFSESAEYRAVIGSEVYVTMMYSGMLRREPDAAGFGYWVGVLDRGGSGQSLIGGFLDAQEYRNRFLP